MRIGWDDSSIQGVSLPDETLLFTMCFDAIITTSTNVEVFFTDNPLPIEIVTAEGELGMFEFQDGNIQLDCGGITPPLPPPTLLQPATPDLAEHIQVYPNPTSAELMIQLDQSLVSKGELRLYDTWGKLVLTRTIQRGTKQVLLPVQQLSNGVYFLEFKIGTQLYRERILKQ